METAAKYLKAAAAKLMKRGSSVEQRRTVPEHPATLMTQSSNGVDEPIKPAAVHADLFARLQRVQVTHPLVDPLAECPVCLAELGAGKEMLLKLPCNHIYHSGCLRRWFYKQSTCPVCRYDCLDGLEVRKCCTPAYTVGSLSLAPRNCENMDWQSLTHSEQSAARLLGFTPALWDNDSRVASERQEWRNLSQTQRNAWKQLGWTQQRWG